MAFSPNGVAALSSPNILAEMFMKMFPMTGWFLGMSGKSLQKKRAEAACQNVDHSAFFPDFHDAHPKREHAGQAEGNLESRLGGTERGVHDGRKHAGIACEYQLPLPR